MSWFNVWDSLKNKTCRYLLQRYLGQFLEGKLNLEQLKVDLYNGKATVRDVSLKVEVLNELFEAQGWAVDVISGHIGILTVTVPWNALMTNDSSIEVTDLFATLRPIKRKSDGTSMLESMWSSASSSMQLAEECMKQKDEDDDEPMFDAGTNAIVGLEKFAETIDNVLNRIKAKFKNIVLRLEYASRNDCRGMALIMEIDDLIYKNETGCEKHCNHSEFDSVVTHSTQHEANTKQFCESLYLLPTFAKHNIILNGLKVYTEEFKFQSQSVSGYPIYLQKNECHCCKKEFCFEKGCKRAKVPIIEIIDEQKIQVKLKQSEEISGPKVCLDVELGYIYSFLTPRQIHLLLKFWYAFNEESAEATTLCVENKQEHDSSEIKNDNCINTNYHGSQMTGIVRNNKTWGEDCEENTAPQINAETLYSEFNMKSNRYCDSLSSSMSSSSTITGTSRFQRRQANLNTCGEILNFDIRIASIVAIILHEDLLFESSINISNNPLNEKSHMDLVYLADRVFKNFRSQAFEKKFQAKDVPCDKNHLYFSVAPLIADGVQQRNRNILSVKSQINATKVEFLEVVDGNASHILSFDERQNPSEPELVVSFKSTSSCKLKNVSSTSIDIALEKATLEIDITIYDRLYGLLGPSPFEDCLYNRKLKNNYLLESTKKHETSPLDLKIGLTELAVKLRFPIIDARPIHDPNRVPWWKRNIRSDFLLFVLNELCLKAHDTLLEIQANEIDIFYCEDVDTKIHVLKTAMTRHGNASNNTSSFKFPKITMSMPSSKRILNFLSNYSEEIDFTDGCEIYSTQNRPNPPFSSKRVCRESDTLHNKRGYAGAGESETVLLPGEKEEINKFCDLTMKASKIQIKIDLPVVDVVLQSKQLYEVIYNRLNTDLLMWEPSSPPLQNQQSNFQMEHSILNVGLEDSLYVPSTSPKDPYESLEEKYNHQGQLKDNINDEQWSTDSEKSDKGFKNNDNSFLTGDFRDSIYISAQETKHVYAKLKKKQLKPSNCSIEININKGSLLMFVPVRDSENHILPGQLGKFDLKIKNMKIFTVSGYNSNENVSKLCLQLEDIKIYHCGLIPSGAAIGLKSVYADIEKFMQSIFYKIPFDLTKGKSTGCKEREMLSLVIEVKKQPDQRIKRLKITTGIQLLALRYHPCVSSHLWLNQLIDFLDVMDYPIEGYDPFGVVTEIQLHLWDCAIDYRPKSFTYRSVIEIGSSTISSNIISSINGCNLRFVLEECVLSIAPIDSKNNDLPDWKITTLPSLDLVPIIDVGLIDISLRLDQAKTGKCPKFDLRCSVHDAHLRSCADSGSALAQLITYIANDGDVSSSEVEEEESKSSLQSSTYSDADIISCMDNQECTNISQQQQQRVSLMMAEAVQETVTSTMNEIESPDKQPLKNYGFEVFYFPDENNRISKTMPAAYVEDNENELSDILNFETNVMLTSHNKMDIEDALPQVKTDLGDIKDKLQKERKYSLVDEDYCIIADEEKGCMSNCGVKNVVISNTPLQIVDNHFRLPNEKPDLLKSPENFPMAELRYTLCEMNFTWHLYGGKDFPDILPQKGENFKREKSQMSEAYRHGVSYSTETQGIQYGKKPKESLTWKSIGGADRNHEVLVEIQFSKVRFSHEMYPPNMTHASRQVLLVSEIEIRDRLQNSDINKFLYNPNIKNMSSKSQQHMLVVKALHVRPNPQWSTAQECSLRISLSPLRLHIDQDTLIFMADFFTNISHNQEGNIDNDLKSNKNTCTTQAPVMTVDEIPEAVQDLQARKIVYTNIDLLMDDNVLENHKTSKQSLEANIDESTPIFFREVIFSPPVPIRFDYHGRRVELSRGPIAGLLMGLGQLQCSEIRLQKVIYRRGLLGIDKLLMYLCKEWLKDIKKNQLQNILTGVGPTYAFVQLFHGIYDLFWLPIEQYQKDGRIVRGLQLGAQSFTARTALAALEITSRIIQLLQFTAETAFDMVSPGPSVRRTRRLLKGKKKRPHRPKDIREGVTNAYLIVKEGINDSANTLIETAVSEHNQKGYTGAVGAVMRQIPQLVVRPAVLATQATTNILGGVKSSLVPEAKAEAREKWKDDSD